MLLASRNPLGKGMPIRKPVNAIKSRLVMIRMDSDVRSKSPINQGYSRADRASQIPAARHKVVTSLDNLLTANRLLTKLPNPPPRSTPPKVTSNDNVGFPRGNENLWTRGTSINIKAAPSNAK